MYICTAQNKNSSDAMVQAENQNAFKYLANVAKVSEWVSDSSQQRSRVSDGCIADCQVSGAEHRSCSPFFYQQSRLLATDETGSQSSARYTRWRQPVQTFEHNHCQLEPCSADTFIAVLESISIETLKTYRWAASLDCAATYSAASSRSIVPSDGQSAVSGRG